jgi:hypothetical protein
VTASVPVRRGPFATAGAASPVVALEAVTWAQADRDAALSSGSAGATARCAQRRRDTDRLRARRMVSAIGTSAQRRPKMNRQVRRARGRRRRDPRDRPGAALEAIEARMRGPAGELFDLVAGTSTGGIIALGLTKPGDGGHPDF